MRVDVGYYALGGGPRSMSRGTRASIAGIALSPSFAFRGGAIRTVRSAERMRSFPVKGKERPGISVGGAEHFTVPPAFPHLREVNVYLGWFGPLARGITATSRATALAGRVPGLRARARRRRGQARRDGRRARRGHDAGRALLDRRRGLRRGGRRSSPRSTSPARTATPSRRACSPGPRAGSPTHGTDVTGAAGPLEAFGLDELERGCAEAGITRVRA